MTDEKLLQVIEKAAREGRTKLDLSGNQLRSLPPQIAQLTNLTRLDLSRNQLASLPPQIAQLTNLTQLYLSDNQLANLPPQIAQLTKLTELYLSDNQLANLPPQIAQLTNLTELGLNRNQLASLPLEITKLTQLTKLDLSDNPLERLPPEIAQLKNLIELLLFRNKLAVVPPEIDQLRNLKKLSLARNQLETLPSEFFHLKNLKELFLDNNQLESLPSQIAQLTNLTRLDLRRNLLSIPPEILEKTDEPATIINYYLQSIKGQTKPLNEAKMLLVGQGSVGKTSLVKRLIDNDFNPQENKTEGINIRQWQISVNDQDIQLNIWDFGGQEIMHATHQFFLTKRSLYLLVLDARLEEEENRLEYWLKIIQSFGGDSPVIVVGNKIDQNPLYINRRGLRQKYPTLKEFVETSCKEEVGIEELKAAIKTEIASLDHVGDRLPLPWFDIKTQLAGMDRDYIPYSEYKRMCKEEGITDKRSQRTLRGFLHDLGIALNFQDDPRLEDTNILNPEWVTNGVYKILNDNLLITHYRGILERDQLDRILDPQKYPRNKHLFIIDMMRKFELCFDIERDKKFLIPDLLPKEETDTGKWEGSLAFQYHYNVLPSSIISRFIVRMNHLISKNTYWRSGVVLANQENRALVKADREDKKIFIWIKGTETTRRNFLNIIRNDFEAIHKTIPRIQADEKVPLPQDQKIVVDYKHLLDLESLGETSCVPPGLREKVNVKELLDGVDSEEKRRKQQERPSIDEKLPNTPTSSASQSSNKFNWTLFWSAVAAIGTLLAGLAVIPQLIQLISNWNSNPTPSPSQTPTTKP